MIKDTAGECVRTHKDLTRKPDYTEAEAQALRAVWNGEATARQQRLALDFIMLASGKDDSSHRPGDSHDTAFAEGKRFVGLTIVWMLFTAETKTDPDKIAARKVDPNDRPDNR